MEESSLGKNIKNKIKKKMQNNLRILIILKQLYSLALNPYE